MEYLLVLVVLLALAGGLYVRSNQRKKDQAARELEDVRRSVTEDVVRLGEDVTDLDTAVAGRELGDAGRQDYRRALDAYDQAKTALDGMRQPSDVKAVTEALEDGRYAVATVTARLDGRPLPTRRPPCFFNPQHGPSSRDVQWSPAGGQPRSVPVCEADAERVEAGADPDSRKVLVGGQRRNYWEAGPGYAPYAQGYFAPYAMSGLLPGVLMGAALGGMFGGYNSDGSYDAGYQDGAESGDGGDSGGDGGDYGDGGDGGGDYGDSGGDGGGMDFGGGDGGGFDFGGGDFGGDF